MTTNNKFKKPSKQYVCIYLNFITIYFYYCTLRKTQLENAKPVVNSSFSLYVPVFITLFRFFNHKEIPAVLINEGVFYSEPHTQT